MKSIMIVASLWLASSVYSGVYADTKGAHAPATQPSAPPAEEGQTPSPAPASEPMMGHAGMAEKTPGGKHCQHGKCNKKDKHKHKHVM